MAQSNENKEMIALIHNDHENEPRFVEMMLAVLCPVNCARLAMDQIAPVGPSIQQDEGLTSNGSLYQWRMQSLSLVQSRWKRFGVERCRATRRQ